MDIYTVLLDVVSYGGIPALYLIVTINGKDLPVHINILVSSIVAGVLTLNLHGIETVFSLEDWESIGITVMAAINWLALLFIIAFALDFLGAQARKVKKDSPK